MTDLKCQSANPSVLIVDDEVDACDNLRDILTDLGYRADTAQNGFEAIERVKSSAYDIALLDLKMPGMDGVSVYRRIKQIRPETVAIVVSAFAGSELAEQAVEEGAARIVPKPVDMAQLLSAIEASLSWPLVLMVDDDADFCQNLWQILSRSGYRLAVANTVDEARRQLATRSFGVVLIDMKLSGAERGDQVFRMVRESNPAARTILVTGFRDDTLGAVRELLSQGVDAVCYKPLDIDSLVAMLCAGRPSAEDGRQDPMELRRPRT